MVMIPDDAGDVAEVVFDHGEHHRMKFSPSPIACYLLTDRA